MSGTLKSALLSGFGRRARSADSGVPAIVDLSFEVASGENDVLILAAAAVLDTMAHPAR